MIRQTFSALVPALLVVGVVFPPIGPAETARAADFQDSRSLVPGESAKSSLPAKGSSHSDFAPYPTLLEMSQRTKANRQQQSGSAAPLSKTPADVDRATIRQVEYTAPGGQRAAHPSPRFIRQTAGQQTPGRLRQLPNARPISTSNAAALRSVNQPEATQPESVTSDAPPWGGYPQLDAPLYPSPKPNVPVGVGATVITNPALAPHEMLYPHTYRSMYPPYYYRVHGFWIWTPVGMRSFEKWELQGTEVEVKYRSKFGLFSGFVPPKIGH